MEITEEKRGEVKIIGLRGRLDAITSADVEKRLLALVAQGDVRMALDLSGLSYISSLGLRVLMVIAKQVQTGGGRLALGALNDTVHEIFKIAGFTELFSVHQTLDEAVTYCAG
jgi:anti-sigma B factor antagonist